MLLLLAAGSWLVTSSRGMDSSGDYQEISEPIWPPQPEFGDWQNSAPTDGDYLPCSLDSLYRSRLGFPFVESSIDVQVGLPFFI